MLGLLPPDPPMTAHKKTGLAVFDEAWIAREGKRLTKGRPQSKGPVRQRAYAKPWPGDPTFDAASKNL